MKIKKIISVLEQWAPPSYQESYDNSGLLTGNKEWEAKGVLCTLDCLEQIVDEAIQKNCNLIVAHHPIIFEGLKQINGKNYVERTIIKAIKNDIAIYAIHTNLDNVSNGVNKKIAEVIGLAKARILIPKTEILFKLEVYCPNNEVEILRNALFEAGVGEFSNYSNCSFNIVGEGTFMPSEGAVPSIGKIGSFHVGKEVKIELVYPSHLNGRVLNVMNQNHSYEEVAHQVIKLQNQNKNVGSGMIGELEKELSPMQFMDLLKSALKVSVIRHTECVKDKVKKIAVLGGSGSFGLSAAKSQGADVFVTADFKYHEFFDAEHDIIIADVGHYESEAFTIGLLGDRLMENFPNFVVLLSEVNTNPVRYT